MSKIVFVTGGARSGKSAYAEKYASELGGHIGYIATAKVTDEDMAHRIEHHRASRPSNWLTIERYRDFEKLLADDGFMNCDTLLLDCMTIMMTNIMFDHNLDYDSASMDQVALVEEGITDEILTLIAMVRDLDMNMVVVSNEVGLGLVPAYRLGNLFRDIAGRMNQLMAAEADEAYLVVAGLPMTLK